MTRKGFVVEVNRPSVYGRKFEDALRLAGFDVERAPHKTTFVVRYDKSRSLQASRNALRSLLPRRLSSVVLFSKQTGKAWTMRRAGNRSGAFIPL